MAALGLNEQDVVAGLARIGYARARRLLIAVGLGLLAVVVIGLLARSVDHVEVIATLLFVPIFLALMFFGASGGVLAGAAATAAYIFLRADAIDAVGWSEFGGTVIGRGIGYLVFGAVGGWAAGTLEASIDKLDLYDQIDDQTGVHNARFLLQDVELERARSTRYQTVFSVACAQFSAAEIDALPGRRRKALLRDLGTRLDGGVRNIDRAAHGSDGRTHHVAIILPETARQGAAVFNARLLDELRVFFDSHGVAVNVTGTTFTVPGDETGLDDRLEAWRRIDAAEHSA